MTQFTDLPNEIVAQIAQNVYPGDIVNFSSTSKFIHSVSEPSLKVHHEMERRYKKPDFTGNGSPLAYLLDDIILQPDAALYVECLTINTWCSRWYEALDHEAGPYDATYPQKTMSRLTQAIADTVPSDQVSTWTAALESGDEDPLLALLLLRLPSVTNLMLIGGVTLQCLFQTLVRRLETPAIPFLSALTTLYLDWEDSKEGDPSSGDLEREWQAINIFACLPSLRSMTMRTFWVEEGVGDRAYLLQPRSSNVTSIIIESSYVQKQPMYHLLQGFKALRRFSYKNRYSQQDPVWIHAALLAHCKASLEYLALSLSLGTRYMGGLRDFDILKEVDTRRPYLMDDQYSESLVLAKVLPASIEKVHLREDGFVTPKVLQDMILNAAKDKQKHLPNLKELRVNLYPDARNLEVMAATGHMQVKCREAGFMLRIE